jgi:hypothetical protein
MKFTSLMTMYHLLRGLIELRMIKIAHHRLHFQNFVPNDRDEIRDFSINHLTQIRDETINTFGNPLVF